MAGGYVRTERGTFRVWLSWKGKKLWINKYLDGTRLFHEAQARRVLDRIRSEIDQGIFDPASWGKDKPLIIEEAWRIYDKQSPCGLSRYDQRDRIFGTYILPYFKGRSIRDIRTIDVQDWFSKLPVLAPSYLRLIRATFRAFLWFHSDSLSKFPKFPVCKVPRKAVPWLTREEQDRVIEAMEPHHRGIFRFMVTYGCRPGEVCNLQKSDIDWQKREITLRGRKNFEDNTLPILPEIEAILKETRKIENLKWAFSTPSGLKCMRQTLYRIWTEASRKAGVKMIPLKNGTRHSKACQLINQNVSLETIARVLGNSRGVVERAYGRVSVGKVAEVLSLRKAEGE